MRTGPTGDQVDPKIPTFLRLARVLEEQNWGLTAVSEALLSSSFRPMDLPGATDPRGSSSAFLCFSPRMLVACCGSSLGRGEAVGALVSGFPGGEGQPQMTGAGHTPPGQEG